MHLFLNRFLRENLILNIGGKFSIMYSSSHTLVFLLPLISVLTTLAVITCLEIYSGYHHITYASASVESNEADVQETLLIKDENLRAELVVEGLKRPTSMAFLGENDFLVLEKNKGTVKRIVNGNILEPPLLDVEVANEKERGMLGISVISTNGDKGMAYINDNNSSLNKIDTTYVFLYFTESSGKDGNDDCPLINYCNYGTEPKGNRLYRYEFDQDKLINPRLLLDLPATPGSDHVGGVVITGPDDNVYITSGDGHSCSYGSCDNGIENTVLNSQSANIKNGEEPNGRGGILRVTQDGMSVTDEGKNATIDENSFLNKYYAYGIRNSFGMDFDPVSGKLWDTENGPSFGDEINLVEPGFNSGWSKIQGIWPISNYTFLLPQGLFPPYRGYFVNDKTNLIHSTDSDRQGLVDLKGEGKYSDPEFIWNMTVGVTALKFLNSDNLGKDYENDMFVADYNYGNLYHFDLTSDRTNLIFDEGNKDRVAKSLERSELNPILFGEGFDSITDIEVGPDGYLYVVSHKDGKIFRIVPVG